MVNPGAFLGSRREFLNDQKDIYAEAVSSNHVADTVADIQRRYFKRFPISLPHDQEPTQEWLDQVDDNAPDPDILPPDADSTDPDAYIQASVEHERLKKEIKMRKDQIKRRLQYQFNKTRDEQTSFDKGTLSPLAILTAKLTGEGLKKPRMRTPYNLWGPEHRYFVDPIFKQRVEEKNVPAKNQAALRSAIYKELFNELPEDEKKEWAERAEREHRQALEEIGTKMNSDPSTTPEDRQKIIQALPKFVEPILDLIADHTGWKVTLIAGGPEPADGGRLNMVSIHSGVLSGSVKMDFGRSERQAYRNYVIPTFGSFLKKCYSIEECRSRALPSDNSAIKLSDIGAEEDIQVHRFESDPTRVHVSKTRVSSTSSQSSASSTTSSMTKPGAPIKFGPPKGRKPAVLRPLPSRNAYTVKLGPAPTALSNSASNSIATSSGTTVLPIHPASAPARTICSPIPTPAQASLVAAEETPGCASTAVLSCETTPVIPRAPTPATFSCAPSPAISRAPTPAILCEATLATSRAPTPAVSRAPTPAPSRAATPTIAVVSTTTDAPTAAETPAMSHPATQSPHTLNTPQQTPATSHKTPPPSAVFHSETQTPELSHALLAQVPTPAPPPSHALTSTPLHGPTSHLTPSSTQALPLAQVLTPAPVLASHGRRLPTTQGQEEEHGAIVAPSTVDPQAAPTHTPTYTPSPASTHPDVVHTLIPPSAPQRPIFKPSGAATVPDPSSFTSTTRPRKRKGERMGEDGEGEKRTSKRTRAPMSAIAGKRKMPENESEQPAKKSRRTEDVESLAGGFNLDIPANCPLWFSNAIHMVTAVDLGENWKRLAAVWVEFEKCNDLKREGPKLGTQSRPRIVADWIQRAHSPKYRPDVKNLEAFEDSFWDWWVSLQPDWRRVEGGSELERRNGEDWDVLQCPGQNGILSVVAALFFWGLAAAGDKSSKKAWDVVIDDVLYAFTHLL